VRGANLIVNRGVKNRRGRDWRPKLSRIVQCRCGLRHVSEGCGSSGSGSKFLRGGSFLYGFLGGGVVWGITAATFWGAWWYSDEPLL
jgi:hypothetical protein